MGVEQARNDKFPDIIKHAFPYVPIVAASFAIIFELGYYSVVGFNFFAVVPLYDHFIAAVIAVPFSALITLVGMVLPSLFSKSISGKDQALDKDLKTTFKRLFILTTASNLLVVIPFAINYYTLVTTLALSLIPISFTRNLYVDGSAENFLSKSKYSAYAIILPFILSFTFVTGAMRATTALDDNDYTTIKICRPQKSCMNYNSIKVFSRGALIKTRTNIEYIDFNSDIEISKEIPDSRHLIVRLYDYIF